MTRLISAFSLIALVQTASAGLKWEQNQIELHPAPGDATAVGTFKYLNDGKETVHIKSVHTSCGCTTTSKMKDTVAPGESGEIAATFKIGGNTGVQQKTVQVETDDASAPLTVLTLRAVIPQGFELKPSFVYWENSEPAKAKTITVKIAKESGAKNINVTSSNPEFSTKVTPAGPNQFEIQVQPHDTSHPVNATLTVQPDNGGKPYYATARVINPSAASR
jgi:hypothetical protein